MNSSWSYSPEMLNSDKNWQCFVPCDLEIWQMTLKNKRVASLCYLKLCASFCGHRSIQIRVTVRKLSIRLINGDFFVRVTLKFDGWHWKTLGYLFYAPSNFVVYNFVAGSTVRKPPIWVKFGNFRSRLTVNLMMTLKKEQGTCSMLLQALCNILQQLVNSNFSYSPETSNCGQNQQFLVLCDLDIWLVTLKNNRTPLLCYFKLCASFSYHRLIQTRVTVWKCPIWVKIGDFIPVWLWNLMNDIKRRQGTSSMLLQALSIIS